MVYPSTVAERIDDHSYIAIGSLLRLGTHDWPPVLATNARLAMELADVTNRPIAFYHRGMRTWATREGNRVDSDQGPTAYEFVVAGGGDKYPVFASCSRELYNDDGITLCATRYGRYSWSYSGGHQ